MNGAADSANAAVIGRAFDREAFQVRAVLDVIGYGRNRRRRIQLSLVTQPGNAQASIRCDP